MKLPARPVAGLPLSTIGPARDANLPPAPSPTTGLERRFATPRVSPETMARLNSSDAAGVLKDAVLGEGGFRPTTPAGLLLALGMGPERAGESIYARASACAAARTIEHDIPKLGEKFAVLTAENAGGEAMPLAENLARNQKLVTRLKALGHEPVPVKGAYFDDNSGQQLFENSFYVPGMEPEQAMSLGKEFGQNSVVTHEGLHDMAQGKTFPSRGIMDPGAGTTYTQLPNGKKFVLDLNWDEPKDLVARPNGYTTPEQNQLLARMGVTGDPVSHPTDIRGPEGLSMPSDAEKAALLQRMGVGATPNAAPASIQVRDRAPSMLDLLDPKPVSTARPNGIGVQQDLPRYVGARTKPQALADIQQEAYRTYTGPEFEKLTAEGNFPEWYLNPRTQQRAIDALGDEQGPIDFNRLMNFMGATTARSDPNNNLRRASYYRGLDMAGLLDPEALLSAGYKKVPKGMGHLANDAHHKALAGYLQEGLINPFTNPKPASFVEDLTGNFRPYTNDTRMATGAAMFNPKLVDIKALVRKVDKEGAVSYSPRDWAYAPMEKAAQQAAHEYAGRGLLDVPNGADPTAFWQAKVWDALGGLLPKASRSQGTFDDVVDNALTRAGDLWGTSPDMTNRLFWAGHPLDLPLNKRVVPAGLLSRF